MLDLIWLKRSMIVLTFGLISSNAFADTTDLFCHESGMNSDVGLYVSIDGSASTVTAWYTGINRDSVSANPATINDTQVIWSSPSPSGNANLHPRPQYRCAQ